MRLYTVVSLLLIIFLVPTYLFGMEQQLPKKKFILEKHVYDLTAWNGMPLATVNARGTLSIPKQPIKITRYKDKPLEAEKNSKLTEKSSLSLFSVVDSLCEGVEKACNQIHILLLDKDDLLYEFQKSVRKQNLQKVKLLMGYSEVQQALYHSIFLNYPTYRSHVYYEDPFIESLKCITPEKNDSFELFKLLEDKVLLPLYVAVDHAACKYKNSCYYLEYLIKKYKNKSESLNAAFNRYLDCLDSYACRNARCCCGDAQERYNQAQKNIALFIDHGAQSPKNDFRALNEYSMCEICRPHFESKVKTFLLTGSQATHKIMSFNNQKRAIPELKVTSNNVYDIVRHIYSKTVDLPLGLSPSELLVLALGRPEGYKVIPYIHGVDVNKIAESVFLMVLQDRNGIHSMREYRVSDSQPINCYPPLSIAVIMENLSAVKALLEKGADVEQPSANHRRETALHCAFSSTNVEFEFKVLPLLLEKTKNIHIKSWMEVTPLDKWFYKMKTLRLSSEEQDRWLHNLKCIVSYNNDPKNLLRHIDDAIRLGAQAVKICLGENLCSFRDSEGNTILHLMARKKYQFDLITQDFIDSLAQLTPNQKKLIIAFLIIMKRNQRCVPRSIALSILREYVGIPYMQAILCNDKKFIVDFVSIKNKDGKIAYDLSEKYFQHKLINPVTYQK